MNVLYAKKIAILLTFFTLLLFIPSIAQTESGVESKIAWIQKIGTWWLFLFIIGIGIIFFSLIIGKVNWKIRKYGSIIGLIVVLLGIFGAEIVYLIPYLGNKVIEYNECKETSFAKELSYENIMYTFACIFVGYAPAGVELITLALFIIFGVIAPLAMLIALFYEFTDFLVNPGVRRVMAFLSALVAYRFLLASLFIDLLGYGFAGLGVLLFDYFFFMVVFKAMQKLWSGAEMIQTIITETQMERIADLTRQLRDAEATLALQTPNTREYQYWKARVERLKKQLEELQGKAKEPSSNPAYA
jgi:polyhydroxyalkanoate synthesis regulator phasin